MGKPRISQKLSSDRTDAERDLEMCLAIQQVDQIADYASRGRVHERLTDQQLAEKWINAIRQCAHTSTDEQRRAIEDLKAEFQLRSIEPPYEQVKLELDRIVADISSGCRPFLPSSLIDPKVRAEPITIKMKLGVGRG
jgi:hypothetical protein